MAPAGFLLVAGIDEWAIAGRLYGILPPREGTERLFKTRSVSGNDTKDCV
jgi:hypothetical protein